MAEVAGIQDSYWDIAGNHHITTADAKRAILEAMGISAATDAEAAHSLRDWQERPWREPLPPVLVIRRADPAADITVEIAIPDDLAFSHIDWRLAVENGDIHTGSLAVCALPIAAAADIGGRTVTRRRLDRPSPLLDGYHDLSVDFGEIHATTRIILAPSRAFVPEWMKKGERRWGLSCQVYALKHAKDWGIGDFDGLSAFVESAANLGATMVGINPLHALFPVWPDACSPYSPSSRTFLNPLMIAPDAIPFAADSPGLHALVAAPAFRSVLKAARRGDFIDYPTVSDLKNKALFELYEDFLQLPPERLATFEDFCATGGNALRRFAEFAALYETMGGLP